MEAILVFGHDPGPLTGAGSNTWLIPGATPTLVDAGSGKPPHLEALESAVARLAAPLAQVLVTHAHPDHAGGAASIAARWPGVRFRKLPGPADGRYPVPWEPLRDADVVPAGDGVLRVVHTPGHATDHACFFDAATSTLFGGDLVVEGTTIVIPASQGGSVARYMESLQKVLDLRPRRVLAGHGPVIDRPDALLQAYIDHRLDRERQILEALAIGAVLVPEIVDRVYPDLAATLRPAAGESVLAHLFKLEGEGRVRGTYHEGPDRPRRWTLC